ncbi:MAG: hypothetical protein AB2813_15520 [Candidatus Sedimenticola endophacoides]
MRQGHGGEAYELALGLREGHEGEPRFDYLLGGSALDSGHLSEGVFALERLLRQYPAEDPARLQLGRGYYLLEQDRRARQEFEQILSHDPEQVLRLSAERFIKALDRRAGRYRRSLSAWLAAGLGHESNLNAGPESTLFPPYTLPASARAQESPFALAAGGIRFAQPLAPRTQLLLLADLEQREYTDSPLDSTRLNLRAGLDLQRGANDVSLYLQGREQWIDGDAYRRYRGAGIDLHHRLSPATRLSAWLQGGEISYPGQPLLDTTLTTLRIGASHQLPGHWSPLLFGSLYAGEEEADLGSPAALAAAERDLRGARAGVQLAPSGAFDLYAVLGYEESRYGAPDLLYSVVREDELTTLRLGGRWHLDRQWSLRGELLHTDNDSNLRMKAYRGTEASLRVRYDFR